MFVTPLDGWESIDGYLVFPSLQINIAQQHAFKEENKIGEVILGSQNTLYIILMALYTTNVHVCKLCEKKFM